MSAPLRFQPVFQTYIWGGDRIQQFYPQKQCPPLAAESWEIADRPEGMSWVMGPAHPRRSLASLVRERGCRLIGREEKSFPLLVKLIDAKENLSIQVHPDEEVARELQGEPKTEMWVALAPSTVYVGLKPGTTAPQIEEAIHQGTLPLYLHQEHLLPSEAVYIPAGTLHSIGAGSLLLEVQQNSNTTYRLHDWGRVDSGGRSRALHFSEGMRALHLHTPGAGKPLALTQEIHPFYTKTALIASPFFRVSLVTVRCIYSPLCTSSTFLIFFCREGEGRVTTDGGSEPLIQGDFLLIPAMAGWVHVEGTLELIEITL